MKGIGVLVDRHDRKKIMIGADLIIAAAGAVLAIVALYMELPICYVRRHFVWEWFSRDRSVPIWLMLINASGYVHGQW